MRHMHFFKAQVPSQNSCRQGATTSTTLQVHMACGIHRSCGAPGLCSSGKTSPVTLSERQQGCVKLYGAGNIPAWASRSGLVTPTLLQVLLHPDQLTLPFHQGYPVAFLDSWAPQGINPQQVTPEWLAGHILTYHAKPLRHNVLHKPGSQHAQLLPGLCQSKPLEKNLCMQPVCALTHTGKRGGTQVGKHKAPHDPTVLQTASPTGSTFVTC